MKEIYKGDNSTDLQSFHGKVDRVMDDIIESWRDLVLPHLLCAVTLGSSRTNPSWQCVPRCL